MAEPVRTLPLADLVLPGSRAIRLVAAAPAARFVLRARGPAVAAATPALGTPLPIVACRAAVAGDLAALWLGPDEWLLLAPLAEGAALQARLQAALDGMAHALTDVGHRQGAMLLSGPQATVTLNAGCPLDFDPEAFPVGMCTRTVLARAEIVLWRTGAQAFRIEAGRSFLPYVWRFLQEAAAPAAG
jgi:sarcosine oxidase subunit gamma